MSAAWQYAHARAVPSTDAPHAPQRRGCASRPGPVAASTAVPQEHAKRAFPWLETSYWM